MRVSDKTSKKPAVQKPAKKAKKPAVKKVPANEKSGVKPAQKAKESARTLENFQRQEADVFRS